MKKSTLFFLLVLFSLLNLNATHMTGGQITWRCIPGTGQFRFYMELYRNCATPSGGAAAGWSFQSETMRIASNNLPRRIDNSIISSIQMKPDSTVWMQQNQGQVAPYCSDQSASLSCANNDIGSVQRFFYASDPITLKGIPPSDGWHFFFQTPCCGYSGANIANRNSGVILRSIMYADKAGNNTQQCYDNSPSLLERPASMLCRGYDFTFNHSAFDRDMDSLAFHFAPLISSTPPNPVSASYASGYDFNHPTPGTSLHSMNKSMIIDPLTGQIRGAVYSGVGALANYTVCVQIDQWRDQKKIGSVFSEIPFSFFDCAPISSGYNHPPQVTIDNASGIVGKIVEFQAGEEIFLPINATDFDLNQGGLPQTVRIVPKGYLFSTDFTSENNCNGANVNGQSVSLAPCAYLSNSSVSFNSQVQPPRYEIIGSSGVSTVFRWRTACTHLKNSALADDSASIHNFVLELNDDACPIPSSVSPVISVRLKEPTPLKAPIMKGISVGLDGKITYQWAPPTDIASAFDNYRVQQSGVNDGNGPAFIGIFNQDLRKYVQEQKVQNYPIYINSNDIRSKIPGKDWYFRMKTESGCSGDVESAWGEPARVIEVEATPIGTSDPRSRVKLNWNRAKLRNAVTDPSYIYESPTHFYIWKNEKMLTAADASDAMNWSLVGKTDITSYDFDAVDCQGYIGFRIEARDTVIMFKQGKRKASKLYDTLYYRTFSVIDTVRMSNPKVSIKNNLNEFLSASVPSPSYEWKLCDSSQTSLSLDSTWIPNEPGRYALISDFGNCIDSSNCFEVLPHNIQTTIPNNQTIRVSSNGAYYQWIDCRADTIIPGATDTIFHPQDTGYYAVIVRSFNYKDTSDCLTMLAIGLRKENNKETHAYIFPNPSQDEITIQTEEVMHFIKLRSLTGQLLKLINLNARKEYTLNLDVESGIYFLEVELTNGHRFLRKIVKQ